MSLKAVSYTLLRTRIEDQLSTSEQGNRFPAGFVGHCSIPYLSGPPGKTELRDFCEASRSSLFLLSRPRRDLILDLAWYANPP